MPRLLCFARNSLGFPEAPFLSLFPLVLLGACAEHHVVESPADAALPRDVGLPPDAPPMPIDAGPSVVDAALPCERRRADAVCYADIRSESSDFSLSLIYTGCFCGGTAHCSVAVDRATRTLRAETNLCEETEECATCIPEIAATCTVDDLDPGPWRLVVNDEPGAQLVFGIDDPAGTHQRCVQLAEPSTCDASVALPGVPSAVDAYCLNPIDSSERYRFELVENCQACPSDLGSCEVNLVPRRSRDLPPGFDIVVEPRHYESACEGPCEPACFERRRECITPELDRTLTYRIVHNGRAVDVFQPGNEARCSSL